MERRKFVATAAGGAALAAAAQGQEKKPALLEMRYYYLRTSVENQRQRMTEWLGGKVLPALKRNGLETVGVFSASVAADAPFLMMLASHPSLQAYDALLEKMDKDAAFQEESAKFYSQPALAYQRMEVRLLRGFGGFPQIEVPPPGTGRGGRLFELRTYESNSPVSLAKKIGMFENGEIEIFRKSNMLPVFFGRTIAGPKMPNLTYMLAFDSMAAREANWRTFATSDEWKKLSATPGLSDAETVSNISTSFLSPLAGSAIR